MGLWPLPRDGGEGRVETGHPLLLASLSSVRTRYAAWLEDGRIVRARQRGAQASSSPQALPPQERLARQSVSPFLGGPAMRRGAGASSPRRAGRSARAWPSHRPRDGAREGWDECSTARHEARRAPSCIERSACCPALPSSALPPPPRQNPLCLCLPENENESVSGDACSIYLKPYDTQRKKERRKEKKKKERKGEGGGGKKGIVNIAQHGGFSG